MPARLKLEDFAALLAMADGTGLSVRVELVTNPQGKRRSKIVGSCEQGHQVSVEIKHWRNGQRCKTCGPARPIGTSRSERHRAQAAAEGYTIDLEQRNDGNQNITWLVGRCPEEHPYEMRVNAFARGQRCGTCRRERAASAGYRTLLERGFTGVLEVRQRHTQQSAYFTGYCPEGHPVDATVSALVSGYVGCKECAFRRMGETSREGALRQAAEEGYSLTGSLRRVGRSGQRFSVLVGECPIGHPVDMLLSNWRQGSRCWYCSKRGFHVAEPATFYVLTGRSGGRELIKLGITNNIRLRVSAHRSNGLLLEPFLLLQFPVGMDALTLETHVKNSLRAQGVQTCRARGASFPGATETFATHDLRLNELLDLVGDYLGQLDARLVNT